MPTTKFTRGRLLFWLVFLSSVCIYGIVQWDEVIQLFTVTAVQRDSLDRTPEDVKRQGRQEMFKIYGSEAKIAVLKNPDKILMSGIYYPDEQYSLDKATLTKPVTLPNALMRKIAKDFSDAPRYAPPEAFPSCATIYGVKLLFQKGSDRVAALYCLGCDHIAVDSTGRLPSLNYPPKTSAILFASDGVREATQKYFPDRMEN